MPQTPPIPSSFGEARAARHRAGLPPKRVGEPDAMPPCHLLLADPWRSCAKAGQVLPATGAGW